MGNWGRRSLGCHLCRVRRIKVQYDALFKVLNSGKTLTFHLQCDQTEPSCNQCAKSGRQCPGHRDVTVVDTKFRDETKSNKILQAARSKALQVKSKSKSSPAKTQLGVVSRPLRIPTDQQSLCFFLAKFVLSSSGKGVGGHFDCFIPLICGMNKNNALTSAFSAVSLAALANENWDTRLFQEAMFQYSNALQQIKSALNDRKAAMADSTLASVFLLGVYEVSNSN